MSYKGAGSAHALAFGIGRNGIHRGKLVLAALILSLVAVVVAPGIAKAAISAVPADDPYTTRGAQTIEVQILASDTNAGTLSFVQDSSANGGSLSAITPDAQGATATFTPADGYAGLDTVTVKVTNETTLEEALVDVNVNVKPVARPLTGPGVGVTPGLTNDNTPTFTYDATTGPGHGVVAGATFSCRIDGIPQNASMCNSGTFTANTQTDGDHVFSVRATAPALNNDIFIDVNFHVDTTPPDAPTVDATPSGLQADDFASWGFTVPEGVAECRLITPSDPTPGWSVCLGPAAGYTDLDDGDHSFEIRTLDDAGNLSTVVSRDIDVDTVVDVTIDTAPVDGNLDARPSVAFSSTEDPDVTYECRVYETLVDPQDVPAYAGCDTGIQLPFLDKNVSYTFDVQVTDLAGNTSTDSTAWLQANTAPAIVEPEETLEAGEAVVLNLGGTDADSDPIEYSITGAVTGGTLGDIDQGPGTVEFTTDADASGTYEIDYEVTDHREGGTVAATAVIHVQPGTSFVDVPPAETNDVTPTWTYESPSGISTFECSLNGGAWEVCDGGSYTPATDLADGPVPHTLEVRAIAEGTYADPTPPSDSVIIDITAPDVAIDLTPAMLSNVEAPTFDFSSIDPTATFECQVDGAAFAACESGDAVAALADGDHTFTVHAVDPATNVGVEASYTWEVDLTEPVVEVTSGTGEGKWTNLRKPTWDFTEADLNLVPTSTTCTVDSQPLTNDCVGPWAPLNNLNDGNHVLTITSTDAAGNIGTATVNFRVTTITPTAIVDEGPASPSGPSASFKFASTTNLGDDGFFECRVSHNGGAYTAWDACDEEISLTGLSSGTRTLQVRAVDSAGNYSSGAAIGSWTWTTMGTAPDTTITSNVTNGSSAAFGFNSPGNSLATFECSIDGGAFSACTSPKSYTGLAAGSHTFSVRATNQVGTTDGSPASHTWTVGTTATPNTLIDSRPAASTTATEASFAFSATDATATFECRIDGGTWAACTSPHGVTGLSIGSHTFDVRATANGKTDLTPASHTWEVIPATETPGPGKTCTSIAAATSNGKAVKIGKRLRVAVRISHRNAIAGQSVTANLLVNGKTARGKLRKRAAKVLKTVDLVSSGVVSGSLSLARPTTTFTVTEDSPKTSYTVTVKRKKGKALRSSVAFTLNSCAL